VFARHGRGDRLLGVELVGRRDVDGINIVAVKHRVEAGVAEADIVLDRKPSPTLC
jgi:hypothetical protein